MMNKEYCERIRISAMAIRDGETAPLAEQEVSKHLESCADCRLEIGRQEQAMELLNGRSRRIFAHDVWPEIATALEETKGRPEQHANVLAFVILCLFLLTYKVVEVLPSITAGIAIKLIPVGVLVLFFALLKQNPFEINPNLGRRQASLKLQGDTR
jgi:anti-sigma factor RsiW